MARHWRLGDMSAHHDDLEDTHPTVMLLLLYWQVAVESIGKGVPSRMTRA